MQEYTYKTSGTCAREITISIEDGIIKNVNFLGGCNGNLKGISSLVKDQPLDSVIEKLEGLRCGFKSTSCPDQLAKALKEVKQKV